MRHIRRWWITGGFLLLLGLILSLAAAAEGQSGFATDAETGLTYYYDADGQRNTAERISVDGKWYNFYPAGSTVDGVDVSCSLLSGWMTMPDGTVRYYPDGAYWYKTGSASVDSKTYFFEADTGALYAPAETEYGMAWYVYEAGDLSIYYALDPQDFHWVHGLYEKDGATYYFPAYATEKGYATGFVTVDGERLYFGSDGKLVTDEALIPHDGWFTDTVTGKTYYYVNGVKNTAARLHIDGKWYNFDAEGARLLGWVTLSDGTVRYYAEGAYWYKTGFCSVEGKYYFFAADTGALYAPAETEYGVGWYVYEGAQGNVYYALDPQDHHWIYGLYTDENGDRYYYRQYADAIGPVKGETVLVDGVRYALDKDTGKATELAPQLPETGVVSARLDEYQLLELTAVERQGREVRITVKNISDRYETDQETSCFTYVCTDDAGHTLLTGKLYFGRLRPQETYTMRVELPAAAARLELTELTVEYWTLWH